MANISNYVIEGDFKYKFHSFGLAKYRSISYNNTNPNCIIKNIIFCGFEKQHDRIIINFNKNEAATFGIEPFMINSFGVHDLVDRIRDDDIGTCSSKYGSLTPSSITINIKSLYDVLSAIDKCEPIYPKHVSKNVCEIGIYAFFGKNTSINL